MSELGSGSGTSYPTSLDTDNNQEVNSPNVGKTRARAEVINDLAAAIVALETELGTAPKGTTANVKTFLQLEHNLDGTHKTIANATLAATASKLTDGTNSIKTKIITMGAWDMDTTQSITVAHGLDWTKIKAVTGHVRDDAGARYNLPSPNNGSFVVYVYGWTSTNVSVVRLDGAPIFDASNCSSTAISRGDIVITYVE